MGVDGIDRAISSRTGRTFGVSEVLWTSDQMCNKDYFFEEELAVLEDRIPSIFDNTKYELMPPWVAML